MWKQILNLGIAGSLLGWFVGCTTLREPEPIPNHPPASFAVKPTLAPNNTDVVLTWTRAKDPDGDPVTYAVVYKDTLVRNLTDTTYVIKNAGYEITATGSVVAYDSHRASTAASFSQVTGLARLRIKSVGTESRKTVYSYDSQNRLASIISADGNRVECIYGDNEKRYLDIRLYYGLGDYGTTTQWPYDYPNPTSGSSRQGIVRQIKNGKVDSTWNGITNGISYSLTTDNLYITMWLGPPPGNTSGLQHFRYSYDGRNLTRQYFNYVNNPIYITSYEYDDKINPFYLSIAPTISETARFSYNNVTKISISQTPYQATPVSSLTTFSYEYNSRGLPVRRTATTDGKSSTVDYTYETY
ncbi:hypothetical protein [Spirosoma rhododendri]|uniref:Fibronectin type-III domain-containing protein n=1 Tax=Spirosoma rhododendri TaxID=2728024 RepID=A0A7L5DVR2_9BACT|nr:hypothetical protein [Spirosoma rhododendri]QJD80057.1 hypothetical protein HH216_17780 [Spirosoma rhododendri]